MKRSIRVSAAVIHRGTLVYAARRAYGESAGRWEFPGGKREEGESGEAALCRELAEELDATVTIEGFLCTVSYEMPSFNLVMDAYLCHLDGKEPVPSVHDASAWIDIRDIDSLDWLPADILVIEELRKLQIGSEEVR